MQAATVLYVARLVPSKDVALLVQVASLVAQVPALSGTRFVVVADGPERARLQQEIDGAGLRSVVTLEPARTGAALVAAYRDADVFLSTSVYEGFGLAVAEAMAAGLPVVATAVGGVTDLVIDGETGLLAGAGDDAALARHVTTLLLDPDQAHRFGMAGRDRAQRHFDARSMAAGYRSLYARAVHPPVEVAVLKSPRFGGDGACAPLPYRIDHLRERGIALRWTDRHRSPPFDRPRIAQLVAASERRATPWLQTALLLPKLLRADATLAFFESEANAWATARRLLPRRRRKPLVVLTCWLADLLERDPDRARRYRAAYLEIDRIVFFSSNQGPILQHRLGLHPNRLRFVPFGVDHERFRPLDEPDGGYVAAVGRDQGRDWKTFMAAAERSGLPVKVAGRPSDLRGIAVPDNVETLGYVEPERYRALLGRARVSVVPTVERAYPSGQTVALESMAMGRATVITATPAMADYLRPDVNALGVPVGDVDALAEAMQAAFEDEALRGRLGDGGRRAVEERFNARSMWTAIGDLIGEVVTSRPAAEQ